MQLLTEVQLLTEERKEGRARGELKVGAPQWGWGRRRGQLSARPSVDTCCVNLAASLRCKPLQRFRDRCEGRGRVTAPPGSECVCRGRGTQPSRCIMLGITACLSDFQPLSLAGSLLAQGRLLAQASHASLPPLQPSLRRAQLKGEWRSGREPRRSQDQRA